MNPIPAMRKQQRLDIFVIEMFQRGVTDLWCATGIWETFCGELYVSEEKGNANDTNLQLGQGSRSDTD